MNARRVLPIVIAVAAIVSGAAGFAAYESHVVNVRARVEERPLLEKHIVPNPDPSDLPAQPPEDCVPGDSSPPIEVPAETCVWWVLRITMSNPFNVTLHDVVIKDRFGAELDVLAPADEPVIVEAVYHGRGQSKRPDFETQVRITWCVNGEVLADGTCSGGQLDPGDSAHLDLVVYTKTNPSGRREYTSPGEYEMNSGATAKWVDPDGKQCSPLPNCPTTPSLEVRVLPVDNDAGDADSVDADETPTPKPPEPTQTPTPEPTESPEATKTPTPEPTAPPEPTKTPTPVPTESPEPTKTPTPEPTAPPEPTEPGASPTPVPTAESNETEIRLQPIHGQPEVSGIMLR